MRPSQVRPSWASFSLLAILTVSPLTLYADEDPALTTLMEAKAAYKARHYEDAELALRHLTELVAAPEREAIRPKILPAIHFYSAAVAWERKDEKRAKDELLGFFLLQPEATLDPGAYSKSFQIFFDAERTEARKLAQAGPKGGSSLSDYATHDVDERAIPVNTGAPDWDESPVKFLLTDEDRKAFHTCADDNARREFVNGFWKKFERDRGTPINEFEVEFYRRVQYADVSFSTEQTRGSLSDRGMVFLVMGPPTYIGRTGLLRSMDVMNMLRTTEIISINNPVTTGGSLERVPSNRAQVTPGEIEGEVETWYYRKERIPKGLPFNELQFLFITRTGYGTGVLQKEARELTALRKTVRLLRSAAAPN